MADPLAPTTASPVDAYKNPYTDDVLTSALKTLNDQGTQRRGQLGTEAFQSGAYGDARHGVEDANITKDLGSTAAQLTAGINSDAFDKAMGWLNTDTDRQTNTSEFNAGLDSQWFQNQLAAMGLDSQIQNTAFTQGSSLVNALLGLDTYDKTGKQNQDNVDYQDWQDMQNWDANKLSQFLGFINGTPGQTGTQTSTPDNSWASMLASSLANIFKQ
jgi:hypothetical protein